MPDTPLVQIIVETNAAEAAAQLDALKASTAELAATTDTAAAATDAATASATASTAALTDAAVATGGVVAATTDHTAAIVDNTAATTTATAAQTDLAVAAGAAGTASTDAAVAHDAAAVSAGRYATAAEHAAGASGLWVDRSGYLRQENGKFATSAQKAQAGFTGIGKATSESGKQLDKWGKWVTNSALGIGLAAVFMGAEFQKYMTQVVTGAAEPQKYIKADETAILNLAGAVGSSPDSLAQAFYSVSSAGFHGAAGINVLTDAAKAAKIEGANVTDTVTALTSALNSYHLGASRATAVTNELIAAVSHGNMHLADLAPALPTILPVAAAAHISMPEVLGMIASMTMQGVTPDESAVQLRNEIHSLTSPNSIQNQYIGQLGLSQQAIENEVGHRGLFATQQTLIKATLEHMGKSGDVLLSAYNQSMAANQDLALMIKSAKTAQARKGMEEFASGQITQQQFRKIIGTGITGAEERQFMTLYQTSQGFNQLLKSGLPAAQPFIAYLTHVFGTSTAAQTALETGVGPQAAVTSSIIRAVQRASRNDKSVTGWSAVEHTLSQMLDQLRYGVEAKLAAAGMKMIPFLERMLKDLGSVAHWLSKHKAVLDSILAVLGSIAALLAARLIIGKVVKAVEALGYGIKGVVGVVKGIPGFLRGFRHPFQSIHKLFSRVFGKGTSGLSRAAGTDSLTEAGTMLQDAATQLIAAAEKLDLSGAGGGASTVAKDVGGVGGIAGAMTGGVGFAGLLGTSVSEIGTLGAAAVATSAGLVLVAGAAAGLATWWVEHTAWGKKHIMKPVEHAFQPIVNWMTGAPKEIAKIKKSSYGFEWNDIVKHGGGAHGEAARLFLKAWHAGIDSKRGAKDYSLAMTAMGEYRRRLAEGHQHGGAGGVHIGRVEITVNGAHDPKAVAHEVVRQIHHSARHNGGQGRYVR